MQNEPALTAVGHAIQLSVAPVFLLTAIGAFLGVLTNRLGRVIDRARAVEDLAPRSRPEELAALHAMLITLAQRARLINRAITLCTITAVLVCLVIAVLFVGAFSPYHVANIVATLFVLAMLTLVLGLLFFLREIFLATASLRIGVPGMHESAESSRRG